MKLEDLKPGLYRITHDIKNPKPDKRMTGDWRAAAVWSKGSVVSIVFNEIGLIDDDPNAAVISAQPYSGLEGARYPGVNELKLGSRTLKRGWRAIESGKDAVQAPVLLEALEPHEARTVDEAIRVFNDGNPGADVNYREIALQLLAESPETTMVVLARVQVRLKERSLMAREYEAQDVSFATLAFKK